jgi:hypothetical protein
MLNSLMQTWTISLGLDKGGYCNELFLRGKRFLSRRVNRIQGKNPSSSRKIRPDFYTMHFLPVSEPKNLRVVNNLHQEESEPKHPQEAYYLPPMSQTHLPVCQTATNLQLYSLGNLFHGSSVVRFEGAMPIRKQGPQPPMSKIIGSTHFPPYVTSTHSQMLSIGDRVRESRTLQVQQGDPSRHLWAPHNFPPSVQVSQYVAWLGNNNQRSNMTGAGLSRELHPVALRPGRSELAANDLTRRPYHQP